MICIRLWVYMHLITNKHYALCARCIHRHCYTSNAAIVRRTNMQQQQQHRASSILMSVVSIRPSPNLLMRGFFYSLSLHPLLFTTRQTNTNADKQLFRFCRHCIRLISKSRARIALHHCHHLVGWVGARHCHECVQRHHHLNQVERTWLFCKTLRIYFVMRHERTGWFYNHLNIMNSLQRMCNCV